MTNTKYTPGPWVANEGSYGNYISITAPGGRQIAKVNWNTEAQNLKGIFDDGDNARLIAAAPELLEALRDFVDLTEGDRVFDPTREKARAAIAKATGD